MMNRHKLNIVKLSLSYKNYQYSCAAYMICGATRATFANQGPFSTTTFSLIKRRICYLESCHFTAFMRKIKTILVEN